MRIDGYRRVLALPGVRSLFLVGLLARVPITAVGIALTLHVVLDLHEGYAAAGIVGAASTIGSAVGAPLLGRFVDRSGLRPMLVVTTATQAVFWACVPVMSFPVLLVTALPAGLLALPVFGVVRQSIAALVPERSRRQAYSLDSMTVEASFMVGPTVAVLLVTSISATVTLRAIGAGIVLSGLALYLLNPPTREAATGHAVPAPSRRSWLSPALVAVLIVTMSATLVLGGTDVGIVAVLRGAGEVRWTGIVMALWGGYSLAGGFVYGGAHRPLPGVLLVGLLGLFTLPVGLVHNWWLMTLLLVPAGALCAPTIAATAEAVSRLTPAAARGEAMGWHGSALTAGSALGAPVVGAVIDHLGSGTGFAAAGAFGVAGALVALLVGRRFTRRPAVPAVAVPAATAPAAEPVGVADPAVPVP